MFQKAFVVLYNIILFIAISVGVAEHHSHAEMSMHKRVDTFFEN